MTQKILYQGDPGSYSYEAMYSYFGEHINYENKEYFIDVFKSISNNEAAYGIIPFENSTTGGVYEIYDLLDSFEDCFIVGETSVKVNHCLMGLPDSNLIDIKKVYSHPQALSQCKEYIQSKGFQEIPYRNTASSAKLVSSLKDNSSAAIANKIAAKIYNLKILDCNINNFQNNFTKFIIISNKLDYDKSSNKITLIITTGHTPGSLYKALSCFADNKINLLKLESRPVKSIPWQYSFFIDIEGNLNNANIKDTLEKLKKYCEKIKILGNYEERVI